MAYETPVERATLELLGRIADALEGIRYAIGTSQAFLAQENLSLRSSNSALSDPLRRIQQPAVSIENALDHLPEGVFSSEPPFQAPTPRQVLNETENAVEEPFDPAAAISGSKWTEPKDYRFTMPTVSDPSGKGE